MSKRLSAETISPVNAAGRNPMPIQVEHNVLHDEGVEQDMVIRAPSLAWRIPDIALALLRVVAWFMFIPHGLQNHFGLLLPANQPFTGAPELFSPMWIAGT